ncbi:hypothetical protein ACFS5N_04890 [Mucilaginibacter ximonensis]|uniref:Carboxypeptidase-like protein n=1 Tax=Mucilaginibacter ximonensis TaxID=538021 RepID=A0ABW5Y919_9SPHI
MRYLLAILVLSIGIKTYAQRASGFVTDKQTGLFISGAMIKSAAATTVSDLHGQFSIKVNKTDTLRVNMPGYDVFVHPVTEAGNTLIISLHKNTQLKEVTISAQRDRIADSLATRKTFAKNFNSAAPKFEDIVQVRAVPGIIPVAGITIIPSQLVNAITYKSSKGYKLKKRLIQDENDKYISSRFNKALIIRLTGFSGDSLAKFMVKYRPTAAATKKMTAYDLSTYIKNNAVNYRKGD